MRRVLSLSFYLPKFATIQLFGLTIISLLHCPIYQVIYTLATGAPPPPGWRQPPAFAGCFEFPCGKENDKQASPLRGGNGNAARAPSFVFRGGTP